MSRCELRYPCRKRGCSRPSWLGDTGASKNIIQEVAGHAAADVTDRYVYVSLAAVRWRQSAHVGSISTLGAPRSGGSSA
jgi:hypothetical protein